MEEYERRILIFDGNDNLAMAADLGVTFPHGIHPYPCVKSSIHINKTYEEEKCLEWKDRARMEMTHRTEKSDMNCYSFFWQSLDKAISPMDCFPVGGQDDGHWYGGGESLKASWPLEKAHIGLSPFVTGDEGQTEWGNVIRKFFLNSKGVSITIEDHTPLFVSINETGGLCIQARFDDFAYYYHRFELPRLNYTICVEKDIKTVHRRLLPEYFWEGHSKTDLETLKHLLKKPIWQVPTENMLTHDIVERYIEQVVGRSRGGSGIDRGYLLLDYQWQQHMGDFQFNPQKFTDLKLTLDIIKKTGFKLVLTINPYVSTESNNFGVGVRENLFVNERNSDKHVPALTWFDDVRSAALLDITNNATMFWFRKKLRFLSNQLNDQVLFYLDIGNTFHVPTYFEFAVPLDNPDLYGEHFVTQAMKEIPVIGVSGASSR